MVQDIIITETGTSSFGILDVPFPNGATAISQVLYGSIGYTVGATLGAAVAAKESQSKMKRRTILFIGDGSLCVFGRISLSSSPRSNNDFLLLSVTTQTTWSSRDRNYDQTGCSSHHRCFE